MLAGAAFAAGGHHAVDDAAILEAGQCEVEGWASRAPAGDRLLHAGLGCRAGPVELGVAAEAARQGGSQAAYGLSAKWAQALGEDLSVGASIGPNWQAHAAPRYQGFTVAALATWTPREDLALHLNLGRDIVHRGRGLARHGLAAEWLPVQDWSFVAERYRKSAATSGAPAPAGRSPRTGARTSATRIGCAARACRTGRSA
ncbi:hypothetical protein HK414_02160 [Ramlibacter terrae]|uniref:Uncharacterized protein n=1 Tax=Ramlibacter terrae TaxID=2732511 RepID=A0ABX6P1Z6_9BURK|nr:hypothetical protein HK414_02160 [Ramlibacter terrae]